MEIEVILEENEGNTVEASRSVRTSRYKRNVSGYFYCIRFVLYECVSMFIEHLHVCNHTKFHQLQI